MSDGRAGDCGGVPGEEAGLAVSVVQQGDLCRPHVGLQPEHGPGLSVSRQEEGVDSGHVLDCEETDDL